MYCCLCNRNILRRRTSAQEPIEAGLYYNADLGLFSISTDGDNWYTISDKNLGATVAWNPGDPLSEYNFGGFFQRGNNARFSFNLGFPISNVRVDASGYGPGNYFNRLVFIAVSNAEDWSTVRNDNLWGATTGTFTAMRGPCPIGWHIPKREEIENIVSLWRALGGSNFMNDFKVPDTGYADLDGTYIDDGTWWQTNTIDGNNIIQFHANLLAMETYCRSYGDTIRPFKNEPTIPNNTWTKVL